MPPAGPPARPDDVTAVAVPGRVLTTQERELREAQLIEALAALLAAAFRRQQHGQPMRDDECDAAAVATNRR